MKELTTYLNFNGNCREAMEFYNKIFGTELLMMPFSDMPGGFPAPGKERLMHARLSRGSQPILMASDSLPDRPTQPGNNFMVSVTCENVPECEKLFKALSENGSVDMQLEETFFAERFAMLKDRFGIGWMLVLPKPMTK